MRGYLRRILVGSAVVIAVFCRPDCGVAQAWDPQTVDNSGDVGQWSSIAYDSNGDPHIAYYNASKQSLMYAKWADNGWQRAEIAAKQPRPPSRTSGWGWWGGNYCRIAIDEDDTIYIAYYWFRTYYWWNGSTWHDDYQYVKLASKPAGGSWSIADVVGGKSYVANQGYTGFSIGHVSLALGSRYGEIVPYVAYQGSSKLYVWNSEDGSTLVDQSSNVGAWNAIAVTSSNDVYVSYYDAGDKNLKCAYFDGTEWITDIVDTEGDVGQMTSIALDTSGLVHITYYDATNADLKHAVVSNVP